MNDLFKEPVVMAAGAGALFLAVWYWLEALHSRTQNKGITYVRLVVRISLRRASSMAMPLLRQHVTLTGIRVFGSSALEFVEHSIEPDPNSTSHKEHILVYLIDRTLLGIDPSKRMVMFQHMLWSKGLPCSLTTDPDVGSVLNPPANI